MSANSNKILVVAAHPDDEIIGCGGTIVKHIKNNDKVQIVFMSDGESSRYLKKNKYSKNKIIERKKAAIKVTDYLKIQKPIFLNLKDNEMDKYSILSITKKIEKIIKQLKPNIIYTHFYHDLNIDHQITNKCVMTAARPYIFQFIKKILAFEINSSTNLNPDISNRFNPTFFNNISKHVNTKKLLLKFYKNELRPDPHPRSIENILNRNKTRGSEIHYDFAEAFVVLRIISE